MYGKSLVNEQNLRYNNTCQYSYFRERIPRMDSKVPKYKTLLDVYKEGSMIKERNRMDLM